MYNAFYKHADQILRDWMDLTLTYGIEIAGLSHGRDRLLTRQRGVSGLYLIQTDMGSA